PARPRSSTRRRGSSTSTSSPRPPTAPPLRSPRYRRRRASAHRSSSRRTRFRARWPPPLPTSPTLARRRPPSRAGSDTRAGCSRTRAGAAARAMELARERRVDLDVRVVEARRRLGGTIVTERADGFLVEAGPDSFLSEKPWALALCRRLGVEDRLVRTDDRFRKVFVWFRGRL